MNNMSPKFRVLPLEFSIHNGSTFSMFSIQFSRFHPPCLYSPSSVNLSNPENAAIRMIMAGWLKLAFIDFIQNRTFSVYDISSQNWRKNWRPIAADGYKYRIVIWTGKNVCPTLIYFSFAYCKSHVSLFAKFNLGPTVFVRNSFLCWV